VEYDWVNPAAQAVTSSVRLEYDPATDDLIAVTDLNGYTTTFAYDPEGNLLTVTNADGVTTVGNSFEQFQGIDLLQVGDRVVSQRDGRDADPYDTDDGVVFGYEGEALVQTDRLGKRDVRHYDVKGRMARRIDPTGVQWEYEFDKHGKTIETRRKLPSDDRPLLVSTSDYDERGNLLSKTDFPGTCVGGDNIGNPCSSDSDCPQSSCGVRQSTTYDLFDKPLTRSDHLGNTTSFQYDAHHNLIAQTDPLGHTVRYTYTSDGRPVATIDPRGNATTAEYDPDPRFTEPIRVYNPVDADGNGLDYVEYVYDSLGRRVEMIDPRGHRTTYAFDDGSRLVSETDPLGNTTAYTYDAAGQTLSTTEPDGALSRIVYTPSGQVAEEIDPLGRSTIYQYDASDRLTLFTDPLGRTIRYAYDAAGRLTFVEGCDAGGTDCLSARAIFDETGNVVELRDGRDNPIFFDHDLLGRLISETNALGQSVQFAYDGRGLLTSRTNGRGQTIGYRYDAAGRMTGMDLAGGSIAHNLDANGNATSSASDRYGSVSRSFDAMDRLVERIDEFGNTLRYEYDPSGNLRALTYSDDSKVVYSYDELNRLNRVEDWYDPSNPPSGDCGTAPACRLTTYAYDSVGNPVEAHLPDGSTVTYVYDAAHQLIGVTDSNGTAGTIFGASYTMDAGGQMSSARLTLPLDPQIDTAVHDLVVNEANQVVSRDADTFTYDADGNLTGGVLDGVPVSISYDELNQMTEINGNRFRYDADGLRIESVVDGVTRRYVHDPTAELSRLLEEHDEDGNLVSRYVYGLGLVSRAGSGGQAFRVYHFDSRGSTVALTDGSGEITDAYAYDPYGAPAGYVGDGTMSNPFRFHGRHGVIDDGNGLLYMRARFYSPELMRWIQQDTTPTELQDSPAMNLYAFVHGNPIQLVDPDGNFWNVLVGAFVGLVKGIVFQGIECLTTGEGCGWEDFAGAAAGGIVEGTLTSMGLVFLGSVAGEFAESAWTWGLKAIPGGQEPPTWQEGLFDLGLSTATGAVSGALSSATKSIGKKVGSSVKGGVKKFLARDVGQKIGKGLTINAQFPEIWGGYAGWIAKKTVQKGVPALGGSLFRSAFGRGVSNQYANTNQDAWASAAESGVLGYAWR
jgi:RHS repeat-associated protein